MLSEKVFLSYLGGEDYLRLDSTGTRMMNHDQQICETSVRNGLQVPEIECQ